MTLDELLDLNPFPGLRPFLPREAELFFGRQRQIDELAVRLKEATLIAVAGASGCGKSSLVLAGLLHALALRSTAGDGVEWRPVVMRPGNHPVSNLAGPLSSVLGGGAAIDATRAAALEGRLRLSSIGLVEAVRLAHLEPRVRVLVVVDQFEEIFRFRRMTDAEDAAAFVKLLLHAAKDTESPVSVVLTLRSDTLGYCADFRGLPEAISQGQYLVPRLTREQRKEAIVGPVEMRGFKIAPRLVQRVLNDVSDDFDDLPVMQHALTRTWRHWAVACQGSRPIDVEDYEAIGRAATALSLHADEVFATLTGLGEVAENVFRALTERVAEGTEVRRPMDFAQLCAVTGADKAEVAQVVDRYRRPDTVFLLPSPQVPLFANPVIDISHESLIRNWGRLKQWADKEAQSAQMYRRVADAAELYAGEEGGLLRDPALQFALDWRERKAINAAWAALYSPNFDQTMKFLDDSRDARETERAVGKQRAARRRQGVTAVVIGSLALAAAMTWLFVDSQNSRDKAESSRLLAEEARAVALSRQLALLANTELSLGRLDRALLLGVAAMRTQHTEEAQDILRGALQAAPRRLLSGHKEPVSSVAFSPDGKFLASASLDGTVIRWDAASGKRVDTIERDPQKRQIGQESLVTFSVDGVMLVSPTEEGAAILWNESTGTQLTMFKDARQGAPVVAISPERRLFASASENNVIRLWDLSRGTLRAVLTAPVQQVLTLAFSADGKTLASGNSDNTVMLWQVDTAHPTSRRLKGHHGWVNSVAFSPDGRTLATGSSDRTTILWDVGTGTQRGKPLVEHREQVASVVFSPDGRTLASSGWDNAVALWDVATGRRKGPKGLLVKAHQDRVTSLAFSPDSGTLASGSLDHTVILWDVAKGEPIGRPLKGHHDQVKGIAFSPDGKTLASAGRDGAVMLWDTSAGRPWRGPLEGLFEGVTSVAFSPDGKLLASGHDDLSVYLWSVASSKPLYPGLGGHTESVWAVAFSPDSRTVASASEDMSIRLWDVASGMPVGDPLVGHRDRVTSLAFSPEGQTLATGSWDKTVILWDWNERRQKGEPIEAHSKVTSIAFSPDGKILASAGDENRIRLWDASSGAPLREPLVGTQEWTTSIAFSPDGKTLAWSSLDTVELWDVALGKLEGPPLKSARGVSSVAFSPDGTRLVSAGIDTTVRLWDVKTRTSIGQPFLGHGETVMSVAFSPDNTMFASGGVDKRLILWDADVASWLRKACAIVGPDLESHVWSKNLSEALNTSLKGKKICAGQD